MKNFLISSFLIITLILTVTPLNATAANLCLNKGFTVGYFNGEGKSQDQARYNSTLLSIALNHDYNGQPISYEVFYNDNYDPATNAMEIYMQMYEDVGEDFGGDADTYYEVLTFLLTNNIVSQGGEILFDKIHVNDSLGLFLVNLLQSSTKAVLFVKSFFSKKLLFETEVLMAMMLLVENTAMEIVYERHEKRLTTLLTEGQKIILVAHSQGGFFLEKAVLKVKEAHPDWANSIGVFFTAPLLQSSKVGNRYITNRQDYFIELLRHTHGNLPIANFDFDGYELMNHQFDKSYFVPTSPVYAMTVRDLKVYFVTLENPPTNGSPGAFTVTMTWDGDGDIDLYVDEPSGTRVAFYNPKGNSGYLDMDNTIGIGPEHYFATCEAENLEQGIYKIAFNNFLKGNGRKVNIDISTYKGGSVINTTFDAPQECGEDCNLVHVANVHVIDTGGNTVSVEVLP